MSWIKDPSPVAYTKSPTISVTPSCVFTNNQYGGGDNGSAYYVYTHPYSDSFTIPKEHDTNNQHDLLICITLAESGRFSRKHIISYNINAVSVIYAFRGEKYKKTNFENFFKDVATKKRAEFLQAKTTITHTIEDFYYSFESFYDAFKKDPYFNNPDNYAQFEDPSTKLTKIIEEYLKANVLKLSLFNLFSKPVKSWIVLATGEKATPPSIILAKQGLLGMNPLLKKLIDVIVSKKLFFNTNFDEIIVTNEHNAHIILAHEILGLPEGIQDTSLEKKFFIGCSHQQYGIVYKSDMNMRVIPLDIKNLEDITTDGYMYLKLVLLPFPLYELITIQEIIRIFNIILISFGKKYRFTKLVIPPAVLPASQVHQHIPESAYTTVTLPTFPASPQAVLPASQVYQHIPVSAYTTVPVPARQKYLKYKQKYLQLKKLLQKQ